MLYCLLEEFREENSVSFEKIKKRLGSYLCLSNEGLELLIDNLCHLYKEFVFKNDAGVKQVQFKNNTTEFKINLLKTHYEVQ